MDTISAFQQKYPLSSNKFFKKIATDLIGYLFFALIITGGLTFVCMSADVFLNRGVIDNLFTWPWFAVGLVVYLIVYAVLVALRAWYIRVYIKRYYYSGEEHYITIKKGVFAPREIHVQYQKIQDVYVDQDILDRILGIYDVHIASATSTSGIEAHIDGVDKDVAEGLKQFLLNSMRDGTNQASMAPGSPTATVQQSVDSTVPKFQLSEEVSSTKYPLTNKWLISSIIAKVFATTVTFVFFSIVFLLPGKNGSGSITSFLGFTNTFLIILALVVVSIIWRIVSLFFYKKNYAFRFDPDMIYYKRGILAIEEKHMPYSSIQNVNLDQGFIDRLLGIADVVIENAASRQIVVNKSVQSVPDSIILEGLEKADAAKITDILKGITLSKVSSRSGL